jgi:hypothetical protein
MRITAPKRQPRSYFGATINLKENSNNFGTIILRKSCADRLGANR